MSEEEAMYEQDGVRVWASILDEVTWEQAKRLARSPVVVKPVALMPDAHLGRGATVGSVIVTEDAILPAAVGVDIGCGVMAVRTTAKRGALPDDLRPLPRLFGKAIPAGVGKGHESGIAADIFRKCEPATELTDAQMTTAENQLGSLGSGNHFLEVSLDEEDNVWLVLHSGSRGIGNQLATKWTKVAQAMQRTPSPEEPDLAYLLLAEQEGRDYIQDMLWAQWYARENREVMMELALCVLGDYCVEQGCAVPLMDEEINCHHNFAQFEDGRWVTRKGAISARVNEMGVIPGSMGAATYIVRGLGNALSYYSAAHGAGRLLSRGAAKRTLSLESLHEMMTGKAWLDRDAKALLDEHPDAYKPIEQVMADQADLVAPVAKLTQIVNYKGV